MKVNYFLFHTNRKLMFCSEHVIQDSDNGVYLPGGPDTGFVVPKTYTVLGVLCRKKKKQKNILHLKFLQKHVLAHCQGPSQALEEPLLSRPWSLCVTDQLLGVFVFAHGIIISYNDNFRFEKSALYQPQTSKNLKIISSAR